MAVHRRCGTPVLSLNNRGPGSAAHHFAPLMLRRARDTSADMKSAKKPRKKTLTEYARKRDFSRTPEPKPADDESATGQFVVQKHAARRLHYDRSEEHTSELQSL